MTRRRAVTAQNRSVARELMHTYPDRILRQFAPVIAPLEQLAGTDAAALDIDAVLDALATLRHHRATLDHQLWDLLGIATLDGTLARHIADTAGVSPRTLSSHLARTPAVWAGETLVTDPRHPLGFRRS
jgi:hypothetical protein